MTLRTFIDPDGHAWEIWEAHALAADRRLVADRRRTPRFTAERRIRRLWRWLTGPPIGPGWLVLRSALGKWRLSPVPKGWESADDEALYRLLARAVRAESPVTGR